MVSFSDFITVFPPTPRGVYSCLLGEWGPQGGCQTGFLLGLGLKAVSVFLREPFLLERSLTFPQLELEVFQIAAHLGPGEDGG